jgi:hypothetical protein
LLERAPARCTSGLALLWHIVKKDSLLFLIGDEMLGRAGGEALLAVFRRLEPAAGSRRHRARIPRARPATPASRARRVR